MNNSAYLLGYYGMQNSGDDALMHAAELGARKLGFDRITIGTPTDVTRASGTIARANLSKFQRIRGENRVRHYLNATNTRALIVGGGSVFHTAQDISIKSHLLTIAGRGRAVGIGLGPFNDVAAERACAKFLRRCSFIGVRDQSSLDIAKALAPEANVELTFDLAPMLLERLPQETSTASERAGICVCLCPVGSEAEQMQRIQTLARALDGVYRSTGEKITLLDFNGHAQFGDRPTHVLLRAYMASDAVLEHIAYDENPLRLLQTLKQFKVVVAMRLHAAILSYLVETPVVFCHYHSKCYGWAQQIGMAQNLQFDANDCGIDSHSVPLSSQLLTDQLIGGLYAGFQAPALCPTQALAKANLNWR